MTCPHCGQSEMVLTDAKQVRFYCDLCKHAWRDPKAPSYDDRRLKWPTADVSGNLITGE